MKHRRAVFPDDHPFKFQLSSTLLVFVEKGPELAFVSTAEFIPCDEC
jgi:hypothetical protein